jgi:CheY-like chemotaxis protein
MMNNQEIEILLVEDNATDAEMTIRALRKSKLANNLLHVSDGETALEFLFGQGQYAGRNIGSKPKVVLLDLKMPKVDGLEVLETMKLNRETCNIPVVILTSSKEHPDVEKCYQLGANSYIVKPVDFDNFFKAITELGMYWLILNHQP